MAPPFKDDPNDPGGDENGEIPGHRGAAKHQAAPAAAADPTRQASSTMASLPSSSTGGASSAAAANLRTGGTATSAGNTNDSPPSSKALEIIMEAFDLATGGAFPQPAPAQAAAAAANPEREGSGRSFCTTRDDEDGRDDESSSHNHMSVGIAHNHSNSGIDNAVETNHSLALNIATAYNNNSGGGGSAAAAGTTSTTATTRSTATSTTAASQSSPAKDRSMLGAKKYCCQDALMNNGRCRCDDASNGGGAGSGGKGNRNQAANDDDVRAVASAAVSATALLVAASTTGGAAAAAAAAGTGASVLSASTANDASGTPSICDNVHWHDLGLCSCRHRNAAKANPNASANASTSASGAATSVGATASARAAASTSAGAADLSRSSAGAAGRSTGTSVSFRGFSIFGGHSAGSGSANADAAAGGGAGLGRPGGSSGNVLFPAPQPPAPLASNSNVHVIPPGGGVQQRLQQQLQQMQQQMQRQQRRIAMMGSMGIMGHRFGQRRPRGSGVETLYYQAPDAKPLPPGLGIDDDVDASNSVCRSISPQEIRAIQESGSEEPCKICLEPIAAPTSSTNADDQNLPSSRVVCLRSCAHRFHLECIRDAMSHLSASKCPECRTMLLSERDMGNMVAGNSPSGTMEISRCFLPTPIEGYSGCDATMITYSINAGVQKQYHPHPGQRHGGACRTAYLPDNEEFRLLLSRLKFAFLHGQTFQVGRSLTNETDNQVTWASIHHKTSTSGGVRRHGYPDPSYLQNCNGELDAVGVPSAQVCAQYLASRRMPDFVQRAVRSDILNLGENQVILFHLIHAEDCSHTPTQNHGAQCSIVDCCTEFKELRQHATACDDAACTFNYCRKAKEVLLHYRRAKCSVACSECGTVRQAVKAATTLGDDIGKLHPDLLDATIRLASSAERQYDVPFFYQEPARAVFLTETSPFDVFLRQIGLNALLDFTKNKGVEGSTVIPNPHLTRTWPKFKAFVEEGKKCASATDEQFTVRIVFHGTSPENVDSILGHGLDQKKRRGQAYGQGEYFASNASMASHYCRRGNQMLIFAVISQDLDVRAQSGVVVVRESSRQLPLGTLTFEHVTEQGRIYASAFQQQLNRLKEEQKKLEKIADEAKEKEKILLLIMKKQYDVASEYYQKACTRNGGEPPSSWAEEVACYVRDHIRDDEEVEIYFPDLPARPALAEDVEMLDVDKCEKDAREAKRKADEYLKQNKKKH